MWQSEQDMAAKSGMGTASITTQLKRDQEKRKKLQTFGSTTQCMYQSSRECMCAFEIVADHRLGCNSISQLQHEGELPFIVLAPSQPAINGCNFSANRYNSSFPCHLDSQCITCPTNNSNYGERRAHSSF
jgi:hypothetical protein